MIARHRRKLLVAGMLAAVLSAPATAGDVITTQQTEIGQAALDTAAARAAPTIAKESYATESNGRPLNPVIGNRARQASRGYTNDRPSARRYDVAARRSCAHLGCRGVHVLGVGF